jgi:hypothetical protein
MRNVEKEWKRFHLSLTPSGYLTVRHGKWPIEIDGLPIKNGGSFHGYVK